jgi:hypothetical protein
MMMHIWMQAQYNIQAGVLLALLHSHALPTYFLDHSQYAHIEVKEAVTLTTYILMRLITFHTL